MHHSPNHEGDPNGQERGLHRKLGAPPPVLGKAGEPNPINAEQGWPRTWLNANPKRVRDSLAGIFGMPIPDPLM